MDIGETIFGNIDFDREHLQENFLLMRERGEFHPHVEYDTVLSQFGKICHLFFLDVLASLDFKL